MGRVVITAGKLRPKPPLERVVQRQIVAYLKAAGWSVWQTSQGHKHPSGAKGLRVSAGLGDLYCLHRWKGAMWLECKRPGGAIRPAQIAFRQAHDDAADGALARGMAAPPVPPVWIVSSLDEVRAILVKMGRSATTALLATAPTV